MRPRRPGRRGPHPAISDSLRLDAEAGESTEALALGAPYPNPAVGRVVVSVADPASVRVSVYDALGREVAVAHDGPLDAGTSEVAVVVSGLAPGSYVVRATGPAVVARTFTVVR